SLYVTTVSFFTVADIGFSQHFMREAGADRDEETLIKLKKELLSAKRFYLMLGLFGMAIVFLLKNSLFTSSENIYSSSALFYSALILVIGTIIQLVSSLDAAILSARADNYFVKLVRSVSPIFTYSIAIIGAVFIAPIEGFAAGFLLANSFLLFVYYKRIKKKHSTWSRINITLTLKETMARLKELFKEGWQLYSVSLGMILRQPIIRYVIAIIMGLPAVGIFDIAMRVTTTSRDVITSGFASLYPSFSYFYRNKEQGKLIEIITISLMLLIPVGAVSLVILVFFPEFIYGLWLGDFPGGIISATIILAVWQFITILNVPFWYLLQAAHHEKIAAIAVWVHTVSVLILIPLAFAGISIPLDQLLIYWTLTALLTQFLIYFFTESKLTMFWVVFKNKRLLIVLLLSILFFAANLIAGFVISFKPAELSIPVLIISTLFIFSILPFYIPILKKSFSFKNLNSGE
ncbi:MAG: oligosaccharide flippase family protein, partial [Ignavibacteriaceae bacterium]|nr:oligosaccharide flippase family protein [Ignavibacteriaceae bacterium]